MDEKKLLISRVNDLIKKAVKTGRPAFTGFLNPAEQSAVVAVLEKNGKVIYAAFGGNNRCERRVFSINDCMSDVSLSFDFIKAVRIDFDAFNMKWIAHRSILGAVLGLGCDRRMVGDVFISGLSAYVFMIDTAAQFAADQLSLVGKAHVTAKVIEAGEAEIGEEAGEIKRLTVAALRIDAVIAGAYNLSRSRAVGLIEAEKVFINWRLAKKPTETLSEGDVVSVRGLGRFVLNNIGKQSAKGRTWIELKCN